ncbi:Vacuolar import and degradation protein 24 [Lachancea thermotolerans]
MINETVKPLKQVLASPIASRSASPPPALPHRLVQSCKDEDTLYRCTSVDSLDSLQHSFRSPSTSADGSRKYISEDESSYGDVAAVAHSPRASPAAWTCCTRQLRPRARFTGFQISDYKKYQVSVTLKTVDLPASPYCTASTPHVTGFLSICGLTAQHPEITTFFEGYAVTDNIGFLSSAMPSELDALKANDRTDLDHWLSFPCFKELCSPQDSAAEDAAKPATSAEDSKPDTLGAIVQGSYSHTDFMQNRFIYMRWKEKFLVPDADVDSVEGASYDGYYYIVHDQLTGHIVGFYYHKDAEKFQQLELTPVTDECSGSCDFEFN